MAEHAICVKCGKCECGNADCRYEGPNRVEHCAKCLRLQAQAAGLPFDPKSE